MGQDNSSPTRDWVEVINEKRDKLQSLRDRQEGLFDRVRDEEDRYSQLYFDAHYISEQAGVDELEEVCAALNRALREADVIYLTAFSAIRELRVYLWELTTRVDLVLSERDGTETWNERRKRDWELVVDFCSMLTEDRMRTLNDVLLALMEERPDGLPISR